MLRLYNQISMSSPAGGPAEPPEEDEGDEEAESQLMEVFVAHSFLAGTPPLPGQLPRPPLSNYRPGQLEAVGLTALLPGAERLFHSQVATMRQLLSRLLSVLLAEILVLRRVVELPSGVGREVLLVDLRWTDVHDLDRVALLVSSGPLSSRHSWMGFLNPATTPCPEGGCGGPGVFPVGSFVARPEDRGPGLRRFPRWRGGPHLSHQRGGRLA